MRSTLLLRDMTNPSLYSLLLCLPQGDCLSLCLSRWSVGIEAVRPQIWPVLYGHFETSEEVTRNVVAECAGKLTLLDSDTLLPELKVRG